MYDTGGRLKATLADGMLAPGGHAFSLDARALPAGVYYCELSTGGRSETRALVIAR